MIRPILYLAFLRTVNFFQTSGAFFGVAGFVTCAADCFKIYLEVVWYCGYSCKLPSNIYRSSIRLFIRRRIRLYNKFESGGEKTKIKKKKQKKILGCG
jgi:hypothetical protein